MIKTLEALRQLKAAWDEEKEEVVDDFDYVTLEQLVIRAQCDLYHLTRGKETGQTTSGRD